MSALPSTWIETTLGAVVPYGATVKAEPGDIAPETWVLELEDIEKDTTKVLQRLSFADRQSKSTKNRFDVGDVLYGKLRPYLNKVTFADQPGVCTTEIVPIKPSNALNGRYLFHWMRHPRFLAYVTEVSHGVNMPRLGTEAGRQAPLVLAPKNEQKRIAEKLDTVLTRVDAVNTRLARVAPVLNRFRQSVLAAATSGRLTEDWRNRGDLPIESNTSAEAPSRLPTTWVWKPMHEVTVCVDSKRVPIKASDRAKRRGSYPYYGAFGAIGSIDEYLFEGDYLLLAEDGKNLESRDRPIALIATGKFWVNNHAHVLQGREGMRLEYLLHWLNSESCDISDLLTGIDQIKLTRTAMDRILVPVPPPDEQAEIVNQVGVLFTFADRLEARLQAAQIAAERLTPSLLAKAFRGELVQQDPNDEPASELLRGLKADRREGQSTRGKKALA